jgi:hypothetical protein
VQQALPKSLAAQYKPMLKYSAQDYIVLRGVI